jgi:glycopeptide antibiotics resistance protein
MRILAAVLLGLYTYVIGLLTLGGTSEVASAFAVTDRFYALTEAQANVALFVPAGFLLTIVALRPLLAVAACLVGSIAFEWVQREYLTTRVADASDVMHNGLGGLVGAVVAAPLAWLVGRSLRNRRRAVTPPPAQPVSRAA